MGFKYSIDESFFDSWTRESAYLLGLLSADGNLINNPVNRGKYFSLTSVDLELVQNMRTLLKSEHRIYIRDVYAKRKKAYQIKIGNAALFERLTRIGLTPAKSHTLQFPECPIGFLPDFIRGYFDGDGCAFLEYSRVGLKRLSTVFTCGSYLFLEKLQEILIRELGVNPKKLYNHGSSSGAYQLRYSTRDSLRLFLFMYHPLPDYKLYLQRKYAIFSKYLELRNLTIEQIPHILDTAGPVAKQERIGLQTQHERVRLPPGPQNRAKT